MKVLHIITGLSQGGAESAMFRLITSEYNSNKIKHIVISMVDFGVYGEQLQNNNIEVYILNMSRGRLTFDGIRKLWLLIRRIRPDIIQTWMYHSDLVGGIIARLAGFNNVVWGIVNFNLDAGVASFSTRLTAKLCAKLSKIVPRRVISCSERSVIAHQNLGYSNNKFYTIPLGYNLNEFYYNSLAADNFKKKWNIPINSKLIGCVARWDHQKDHQNLLRAFAEVITEFPDVFCVLVGPWMDCNNQELISLVNKIEGIENRLILAGRVDSIPNVMSALDLHVLPSLGEAFPNVVAEAMACETPCLVTDVGDAGAIVENTGWVVPPANTIAMVNKLRIALIEMQNKEEWKTRGINCRRHIEANYSMKRMFNSYNELWELVANKQILKIKK